MDKDLARKIVAVSVCLGFCFLAQVEAQLRGSRLPGEWPPPFLLKWGTSGTGNGEFDSPYGVAVDASGNVYVSDRFNFRVQKFDSSGTYLTQWGSFGSGDGQFKGPAGVAIDVSGNVYVVDSGNHRVQKFDSMGNFLTKWGGLGTTDGYFSQPQGVAVDTSGSVYVADWNNHRIQKFDSTGTFLTKWGTVGGGNGQFAQPMDVAVDAAGNLYVADRGNDRIQKFTVNGAYLGQWGTSGTGDGQFDDPYYLAVDASGNVYVADHDNHRIQKFDGGGLFQSEWGFLGSGDGLFNEPHGVAVDASGNVYVADEKNDRIQKFGPPRPTPVFLAKWGQEGIGTGQFEYPRDVAVDSLGNVYVADTLNDRIQKFSSSGAYLYLWGTKGAGPNQFDLPSGIATDSSGNVYVADTNNHRVQKFTNSGAYLTQWGTYGFGNIQFVNPRDVAVDSLGNVYVADTGNNRVQKFNSSGAYLDQWGTTGSGASQFGAPSGIATDSSGNVYVADSLNHRIQKFTSSGSYITEWGSPHALFNLVDVTVGPSDGVYTTQNVNLIRKYTATGTPLTKWGRSCDVASSGLNGCDGYLYFPTGIAVDASGNVYVAERDNHRVSKFGPCSFDTAPTGWSIGFAGGASTFDVDAVVDACGWSVASNRTWIQLTSGVEGIGDGTVGYSVDPNPTGVLRVGSITLTDRTTIGPGTTFTITQDPIPCTYSISPTQTSFPGAGGSDSVSVATFPGCVWTAVANDGWISVDSGSPGNGNGAVGYTVAANAGLARVGTMTIAGKTFTVNQDPQVPDSPSNLASVAMSSSKVKLTWTDNASNEAELRVERKLGAAGTFAQIVTLPPDTAVCTDTGLQRRTEYIYRVMACNSAGCSAPSNEVSVTTPALGIFIGEEPVPLWPRFLNWFEELKERVPVER
jgi:streptogramin lyase